MFSIEQSLFLKALGQAIGNSLWQVAALWLVYATVSSIGRLNANRKYQLAAGTSLAGFAWFIATLIYGYFTMSLHQTASGVYAESTANTGNSLPDQLLFFYHSATASVKSLVPYISCAYLLMFILLSIRLCNSFRQVQFITTQGLEKVNIELRLFVRENAAMLGIARKVKIFASHHVQGPLTMGFWKPVILMPVACLTQLSITEIEAILLHELAHIRRHDYLVNIFLQIAEISLFFNPFMRLLLKHTKQERENNCDDYVLKFGYSPKDYAKALLAIEHGNNTALLALAAKGNQSFQLLNRVKRMVAPQPKAFNYRQQLGMLLLFTVLMLGFTVIVPQPKKALRQPVSLVSKKVNPVKKVKSTILAETPALVAAPPPPPAYDLIQDITNHYTDIAEHTINLKALEAASDEWELDTKDAEAFGKEMEVKMKPLTDHITAWANKFSETAEEGLTYDKLKALANLDELKNLPIESLTEISNEYQKKLMSKLDHLFKAMPFANNVDKSISLTRSLQLANSTNENNEVKEKSLVNGRADFVRQQANKNRFVFRELQNVFKIKENDFKILQAQAEAKQSEALAKTDRLNLGLLTDDRDTAKAEGDGLLAKLQARRPGAYNLHFKTNTSFNIPQEIRINNKHTGKCIITVTDNDVKVASDDAPLEPATFNLNSGQNIDIRHEKQINNGKEEKVVIISISSSK